jgi:hypothetical protein
MRMLLGFFGSLLLLACLGTSADADRMRHHNDGRSSMFAPAPHGPALGPDRRSISRHVLRRQAVTRPFRIGNPGPVPPLTGTTVPPFSVGGTRHTDIIGFKERRHLGKHHFRHQAFLGHGRNHRFHRFHGGVPAELFFLFAETHSQGQVEIFVDAGKAPNDEAAVPSAPVGSVAGPATPTWRSGRSVLTGTLEQPQIIFVNPERESRQVRIFAPSGERASVQQIVEAPAQ